MDAFKEIRKHEATALHLVPSAGDHVFSKIGGLPNLPPSIAWPTWKGKSLAFIAQLDLEELLDDGEDDEEPGNANEIRTGRLYFFYDQEQSTWGFDPKDRGSWRVFYSAEAVSDDETPAPADLAAEALYEAKHVQSRQITLNPSGERLGIGLDVLTDDEHDRLDQLTDASYQGLPRHQIGGYPYVVQNDSMELECQLASNGLYLGDSTGYSDPRAEELASGVSDWRLLLQIDTDDDTGMMWGDSGLIYFWIRRQDLNDGKFENAWMILQCF